MDMVFCFSSLAVIYSVTFETQSRRLNTVHGGFLVPPLFWGCDSETEEPSKASENQLREDGVQNFLSGPSQQGREA